MVVFKLALSQPALLGPTACDSVAVRVGTTCDPVPTLLSRSIEHGLVARGDAGVGWSEEGRGCSLETGLHCSLDSVTVAEL